ncbi:MULTISPECIES: alpha/beta hydrolase [Streptomyces]|uniref:Esterase n=2 Tax=Streptomyces TaxID=1883 RepID=A0ABS9JBP2_9ACTN|nr:MULTISPECIES: alpha/beta hydrolase-fold protein [Streptomyces]MCG0062980.1 esterase [Streptomyces tricolor]MYU29142.1 esterase [Streptomyces sp. SID7810]BCM68547.1 putative membrane protein [Streptomyces sp. EAS-AB2608]CUW30195.1 Putative esterase [Streptomyces reticuli]
MGLTSDKVLALAILIAVVLFIGTVWLWPRLARQSWRAVSGRIGLLLSTQVALFACVGLAANQAFGFYASWADLFGKETGQGLVIDHAAGGTAGGPLQVASTSDVPGVSATRPQTGGQIQKVNIVGRKSRLVSPAYVYLPPEYFQPQYRTRTFPVSVVLTGYPGTARSLVDKLNYPSTAQRLAKEGRVQPMILVMLRPTVAPPRDTECVDVPGGPQAETFFAKDLPDAVRGHYRVGKRARSWGIIGDSTGGYCALKLAMHHPNVYAAGAGLSAYYKAPIDPTTGDLFHGDKKLQNRADLFWFLQHEEAPDTSLLVTSSKVGEHNYKDTLRFIDRVQATNLTRISSIILDSGGHNFNTWRREIPPTLQWISGRLSDR